MGSSFFFFSRPQSSEFLQPARVEMLEKVSNSQAKPLSITKFPSQLIETPVFLPASKIPLGNRLCEEQIRWVPLNLRISTTLSILRKYAQRALCTKTPLNRVVTGKTFTDTENKKNNNNLPIFRLGLPYGNPVISHRKH